VIDDAVTPRDVRGTLAGDVADVARSLLGWRLTTVFDGIEAGIIIDEVEAYGGSDDPASHAFRGRTARNASMFEGAGTLYVYRIYGIHWCANIVTGPEGEPSAVLIRGGLPAIGRDAMIQRRGSTAHLSDGPGKVCQALGITGVADGTSVIGGPVRLEASTKRLPIRIEESPRVGISTGTSRRWRFVARNVDGSSLALT
jgi:DNA-3-methyladenine glycosylase